jgi:hypothetical protein
MNSNINSNINSNTNFSTNVIVNEDSPAKNIMDKLNILSNQNEIFAQGDNEAQTITPEVKTPNEVKISGVQTIAPQTGSGKNKTFYFIHDNHRFKINAANVDSAAKKGFEKFKNVAKENKSQMTFYIQNVNGKKQYKFITKIEHNKTNTRFLVQKIK